MRVIVCGAGQVGTTIARHLASEGISVTVIDIDQQLVRRIDESYDVRGVVGHASYPATLKKADARDADMLIAVTRSDEVNMVACQVAYSLFGIKRRIARLRHAGYLAEESSGLYSAEHLPVDIIISPEIEIAEGIAWRLRTPGAFDMVPMAGGLVELLGIHVESTSSVVVGERVGDVSKIAQFEGASIVACIRKGRSFVPDDHDRIEVGDDIYVIVRAESADEVMAAFGHRERVARNLVIVGGGNVGLHLVRKILQTSPKVNIKIIEQDLERARHISDELGAGVIVLHGDALDQAILEEAQTGLAETIVAVTNDDETNIFASVLAKRVGCKRAITLINKRNYEALTPTLGIDAVVSPSAVTISTVLRHVRRGSIAALHTLREDFGEVIEAEITEESRLIRRPLNELGLPPGMRIGAIVRDGEVLIPHPDTQLRAGDHIVALVTYSYLRLAEALLGARRQRIG
ncbi:Trk system potassium transporter TrkA (plasmid) [Pseudomonas marginalis]|jgi:trk system potassium uptake protein TrkA|uniref:Trk system potassium transporter TrkA n=1 Tax=Gammaproteobacteria TaxID=1236 RepID=UPI000BE7F3F6|nr:MULTISPECIES: Trk system potassium transporter TrkA [Enterobacteriaceae]EFE0813760.1 Trk system potassium transporter TrkA [Escherichia coli]EFI6640945.1 Trk system potassium transporter TrkA [Escherichia coli]HAT3429643.1 Trk system potassium transporter TrkA [Citrobacter freundii]